MAAPLLGLANCFEDQGDERTFKRGDIICTQGEPFVDVFFITSGIVKIYDLDVSGNERTITMFPHAHVFPLMWLMIEPSHAHAYYYEAYTEVTCLAVPRQKARDFISQRPELLMALLDVLTKAYMNMAGRIQNLEKSQIHERLHFVLYWLSQRLGDNPDDPVVRISAPITQGTLASLSGVSREAMSHEINRATGERVFWRKGHYTYIDISRLAVESMPKVF
jgi:CRP-like cAMP-binding protein